MAVLQGIGAEVTVLGSLKRDIEALYTRLLLEKPEYLLGVADTKKSSVIEPVTINDIHGRKINKDGAERLELFIPSPALFKISTKATNSFCNYSMYKIAEFINLNNLETKLIFVHLNKTDDETLMFLVNNCLV